MKLAAVATVLLASATLAHGQLFPGRPDKTYVADTAHVFSAQQVAEIAKESKAVLHKTGAPIAVATIDSLGAMQAANLGIEAYSRQLFDLWRIGSQANNKGILVVLSRDDHKARIEFGLGWAHKQDVAAEEIMQSTMIPRFRSGAYGEGLVEGVHRLSALARGVAGKAPAATGAPASEPQIHHENGGGSNLPYTPSDQAAPFVNDPGESFDFPSGPPFESTNFNPLYLFLAPLACIAIPFLLIAGLIAKAARTRNAMYGNGGPNDGSYDPNMNNPPPFRPSHHHHHHHHSTSSSNSSSSSDSSSSSSSSDSGGFSSGSGGGGGSTGSW